MTQNTMTPKAKAEALLELFWESPKAKIAAHTVARRLFKTLDKLGDIESEIRSKVESDRRYQEQVLSALDDGTQAPSGIRYFGNLDSLLERRHELAVTARELELTVEMLLAD